MNDQEINIAIAEARGWKDIQNTIPASGYTDKYQPTGKSGLMWLIELPDYCNDLNAMHEGEKILNYEQLDEYYVQLSMRMVRPFHATARQRAEAFLRTIAKWKEAAK